MRSPRVGDASPSIRPSSGAHERRLAISTIALQGSQVVAVLSMLAAITVIARELSLAAFGTYGLLVSVASYMLFVQGSTQTAAIKEIAAAADQEARDRAFSAAMALYAATGVAAGALVAAAGTLIVRLVGIPSGLDHQAQLGVFALAVAVCIGWPLDLYQDALRATHRFVEAALAESVGYLVLGGTMIGLALLGAPLWALVGAGASIPFARGTSSAVLIAARPLSCRYRRVSVGAATMRRLLGLSSDVFVIGVTGVAIYSLDRVILGAFRPIATVGLYEGPVRAHNLVLQTSGELAVPVLPAATQYGAQRDVSRQRDLLLRGSRYTLAVVVPLTIVFMVLAKPILTVWLGPRYAVAAPGMAILLGYLLINGNGGVVGGMLLAAGRARQLAIYSSTVAAINLVVSLVLTPVFGLNGVMLGTTVAYVALAPYLVRLTVQTFPVTVADLGREAWAPAYTTGAALALALVLARMWLPLRTLPEVAAVAAAGFLGYLLLYYAAWLRPNERTLIRSLLVPIRRPALDE